MILGILYILWILNKKFKGLSIQNDLKNFRQIIKGYKNTMRH